MLKGLRNAGHSVRYIVAGEYGELRDRAHWHGILFFKGDLPVMPAIGKEKQSWAFWPHGYVYCQHISPRGYHYVLKYLLKDQRLDGRKHTVDATHYGLSKKPPLGAEFLTGEAVKAARQGSLPPEPTYQVPGARGYYWLLDASRDLYLKAFAAEFWRLHGTYPRNLPDWAETYMFRTNALPAHHEFYEGARTTELEWRSWYGTTTQQKHGGRLRSMGFSLRSFERAEVYGWQVANLSNLAALPGNRDPGCHCPDCKRWRKEAFNRLRLIVDTPF